MHYDIVQSNNYLGTSTVIISVFQFLQILRFSMIMTEMVQLKIDMYFVSKTASGICIFLKRLFKLQNVRNVLKVDSQITISRFCDEIS